MNAKNLAQPKFTTAIFINAPDAQNIVLVRGTTEGINLIAKTFSEKYLLPGDNVIVSTLDHHANIVPWQQECFKHNAELRAIPIDKNGDLNITEFERLISPKTKFISVCHVNNTFGTINDVKSIIDLAHSHNIPVLLDGAQSVAHTKQPALRALGYEMSVRPTFAVYNTRDGIDALVTALDKISRGAR